MSNVEQALEWLKLNATKSGIEAANKFKINVLALYKYQPYIDWRKNNAISLA